MCGSLLESSPTAPRAIACVLLALSPCWLATHALADDKRPVPDYDGRGAPPRDQPSAWLWAPRILVSPLYLTSEYILRRPLGALVVTAEREHWPAAIMDWFIFDKEHHAGVVPTAFVDFGFRPSVGLYGFADDVAVPRNEVRLNAATWGESWLSFALADRYWLRDGESSITARGEWTRRPDYIFHGIGPLALESDRSRYGADLAEVSLAFDTLTWRQSSLRALTALRSVDFRDDSCCDDPSVSAASSEGKFALPPAWQQGYAITVNRLEAALDTRQHRPATDSGVRVEAMAEHASRFDGAHAYSWIRYGGSVGGFVDLNGYGRVLSLWMSALFADPVGQDAPIPFTEQIRLGGKGLMRGYRDGRLVDRSAAVATLQYEWPVWVWLHGAAHVAVGNVFGTHLAALDPELLRVSSGVGLRTTGHADHFLELLVGMATETVDQDLRVTSFRLVLGGNRGF